MPECTPRPIGTEFEQVREAPAGRVVERFRVIGLTLRDGMLMEVIELTGVVEQPKTLIGGSERKQQT